MSEAAPSKPDAAPASPDADLVRDASDAESEAVAAGTPVGSGTGPQADTSKGMTLPGESPRRPDYGGEEEAKVNVPMLRESMTEDIVRLTNVHKTYLLGIEGVPALRGVTSTIRKGEFVIILGKSGSGKTTMLNILGTIDVPTRGDLYLAGTRISSKTPDSELAANRLHNLGFVFQTFNLLPAMTALENVEMPMTLAGVASAERKERAKLLLQKVGMGHRTGHTPSQLSGGEQQRVTIARALANRPSILLLDEPTGDLDSVNSDNVLRILTDLNSNDDTTLIMVTHDVYLRKFAHRVIHMLDGKMQRVELVPDAIRQKALAQLRARTSADGMGMKADPAADLADSVAKTIVRQRGHYSSLTA